MCPVRMIPPLHTLKTFGTLSSFHVATSNFGWRNAYWWSIKFWARLLCLIFNSLITFGVVEWGCRVSENQFLISPLLVPCRAMSERNSLLKRSIFLKKNFFKLVLFCTETKHSSFLINQAVSQTGSSNISFMVIICSLSYFGANVIWWHKNQLALRRHGKCLL